MEYISIALQGVEQPACAADRGGRVRAANGAWRELLSVDAGGDLHAAWQACLAMAGGQGWQRGIEMGGAFGERLRPFNALGRWRYQASPVFDDASGARWLVTLSRESLDDHLDDGLIRLSLHAAVRAGRMGLWEWNPKTGDSLWSPEMYDVLRLPRGSGVEPRERFLGMLHPDDAARLDAAVTGAGSKGGIDPFVFRVMAGDGSTRWLMSCAQASREPGQAQPRLVGVNIDVTDTVEAEQRLDAARLARERQEQIMRAVMEHAPVGVAVALHGEDGLAYVSRFGAEMVGATPELGRTWEAWQLVEHDGRTPGRQQDLPLYRATQGEVVRNEEWFLRRQDGSLVPVSCNAGPIQAADGSVVGGTVVWYDVTPFKEAQRQRELFLAAVSHELRTPLSAIMGWSEALRRWPDPALLERGLVAIARNVETEARLVDDLLDFSRMAAGTLALHLAPDDLRRIVRAAVDTVAPIAMSAQVVLDFDAETGDAPPLPVMADELRLRQAVWNLLTNAVKFSREGGLVAVRLGVEGDMAELQVTDHGVGIAPQNVERVFEEFWQSGVREAGRASGLGLGLAIARHIVNGHSGALAASSPGVGQGATFTLRMPMRTSAADH